MLALSRSARAGLMGTEARDGVEAAAAGPKGVADKEAYKLNKNRTSIFCPAQKFYCQTTQNAKK